VSFEVAELETTGLIGPNGAGKTTLFEVISGFTRPERGRVVFAGQDLQRRSILRWDRSPEARARLGLVRSFQDASLFPTMTVEEVVMLAFECMHPTGVLAGLSGWPRSERAKRERGGDLISIMGLDPYRLKRVQEISTGTRRILELTALIALGPRLLLLDEPSSGIAQRESEALAELLLKVKRYLRTTMIVIEHDIPIILAISDRMLAMESGRIIASGTPQEVRSNPLVVESYLGGDLAAIQRSGEMAATAPI